MKVLLVNKFFFHKGGAEGVFFDTARLLERYGHRIDFFSMAHPLNLPCADERYFTSYADYESRNLKKKISSSLKALYSFEAKQKIGRLIREKGGVDIAHIHNIYHQISPSILRELKKRGVPIVMSLHDFKLACATYLMAGENGVCDACKNRKFHHCLLKKCANGSLTKSCLLTLEMFLHHHILRIYDLVDIFISPSEFHQSKLKEMGFKREIVHLPNPIILDGLEPAFGWKDKSIVYFGRLSPEKGLFTLLEAMKKVPGAWLKIIGDGPMRNSLEEKAKKEGIRNVSFLGYKSGEELQKEIKASMFTVFPSQIYENNPRAILESFALGKPVIGSNIGGIPELVKDKLTGLLFEPKDADGLNHKIKFLLDNPARIGEMGKNARGLVESEYNCETHYRKLIQIYENTIASHN